eukprot:NODE_745_length_4263_cov_0.629923.p3 type:complete len:278 gc:universal NODE_745_length_4263_cov_0.629923:1295-2128(+)
MKGVPKSFRKYPLIANDNLGKLIANQFENSELINLTAGLCLIEKHLKSRPKLLLESSPSMVTFQEYSGKRLDYMKEVSLVEMVKKMEFGRNCAVFVSLNNENFPISIRMFLKFISSQILFWKSNPLPLYILSSKVRGTSLLATPGDKKYSRVTITASVLCDITNCLHIPSKQVVYDSKDFVLTKLEPKQVEFYDFMLFDYFVKNLMIRKASLFPEALAVTASNVINEYKQSRLWDMRINGKNLKDTKTLDLKPSEFVSIFVEWKTWPCVRNGLLGNF